MARTTSKTTTVKYGFRRVPKRFGKGTKIKFGKINKSVKVAKTRVPRQMSSEQIVAGIKDDVKRLEGVKAVEHGKNVRAATLSAATNASQAIGGLTAPKFAEGISKMNSGTNLSQLVSGGISNTTNSRDDDEEGSSEVM